MKKYFKYGLGGLAAAAFVILILVNNKTKLEAGIIKENNSMHTVAIEEVNSQKLTTNFEYAGITEAVNDVELLSETSGMVERVFAENGSSVETGTPIVKVDDRILDANFKLAEAALDKAKLDCSRFEILLKEGNLSVSDYENSRIALKNAEAQYTLAQKYLGNTLIKSPISGIIVSRFVNTGSTVAPGTPIANIVDISKLKIKISIPEKDLIKLKTVERAEVTSNMYPTRIFEARVLNISVKAGESHNYTVELLISNLSSQLSAGMYVQVNFAILSELSVLSIPRVCLIGSIKDPRVYIIRGNKAIQQKITLGGEAAGSLIVVDGLKAGDMVVTEGQNNIQDGSEVIVKNENEKSSRGSK